MVGRGDLSAVGAINRPEIELLLCCARTNQDLGRTDRIGALLRDEIDWTYLLWEARRHGTTPLLYWNLNAAHPEAVPKDVMEWLRDYSHANSRRNLLLTGELLRILELLEEREVNPIPYKGPVLAATAYGNLGFREFGDLDILLDEKDVLGAGEALTSLGYRPKERLSGAQEAAFLRYERQYEFARDDGTEVELQWTVVPRYLPFPLDPGHVWERGEQVSLGGRTVRTFSREDLLLTLCVHGLVHCWGRLGWVCDVAELVRSSGEIAWESLIERANALNSRRMFLLGLLLCNQLLGLELDAAVLREVRADASVEALARDVRQRLFSKDPEPQGILEGSAFRGFHLRTLERVRDKLWYCGHRLMTPTLWEWRLLPLPAVLFPCYRLLRPSLLTGKLGARLAKRFLAAEGQGKPQ